MSFIVLLGAFYVIAGRIHLRGDLEATPTTKRRSWPRAPDRLVVGTTGASMLLIRPLLQTNPSVAM